MIRRLCPLYACIYPQPASAKRYAWRWQCFTGYRCAAMPLLAQLRWCRYIQARSAARGFWFVALQTVVCDSMPTVWVCPAYVFTVGSDCGYHRRQTDNEKGCAKQSVPHIWLAYKQAYRCKNDHIFKRCLRQRETSLSAASSALPRAKVVARALYCACAGVLTPVITTLPGSASKSQRTSVAFVSAKRRLALPARLCQGQRWWPARCPAPARAS